MTYNDLYFKFKSLFPNEEEWFKRKEEESFADGSEESLIHVCFGLVVVPFIIKLLNDNNIEEIKKAFSFLEEMEKDTDSKVAEVVEFSVLEPLSDGPKILGKAKPYMGPGTREALHSMAWWLNIDA